MLLGGGYLLMHNLTATRGTSIFTKQLRLLTLVLGVVMIANCVFGLLREVTWIFTIGPCRGTWTRVTPGHS